MLQEPKDLRSPQARVDDGEIGASTFHQVTESPRPNGVEVASVEGRGILEAEGRKGLELDVFAVVRVENSISLGDAAVHRVVHGRICW